MEAGRQKSIDELSGGRGGYPYSPWLFVLHLCQHLYKEATTYPWVAMKRDMTLYKFCDIYALLQDWTPKNWQHFVARAKACHMEAVCYYALYLTKELFAMEDLGLRDALARLVPTAGEANNILHTVTHPEEKRDYLYTVKDVKKRFFTPDRTKLLKEGEYNEQITYAHP